MIHITLMTKKYVFFRFLFKIMLLTMDLMFWFHESSDRVTSDMRINKNGIHFHFQYSNVNLGSKK